MENLSLSHDKYYAVCLDGRVMKTFYKDQMALPSKALAIALAEEWESQGDTINLKGMTLNQMYAKGVRASFEPGLLNYKREQLYRILQNDQICYRNDPESQNDYQRQLAIVQRDTTQPVFEFLKAKFDIRLEVWH